MSNQRSDWRERLHANPSRMEQELAINLQQDQISYRTQVEIPVTTADFYFPAEPRPLLVFVDGPVHLKTWKPRLLWARLELRQIYRGTCQLNRGEDKSNS